MNEELKVIIKAEVDKLKTALADSKREVKTFSQQVADAGKDVDKKFMEMGESISNGMKTAAKGAAGALAGVAAALVGTSAATEEYRNQQALLNSAFESAGGSAETAKQTYNDLYRVLGDGGQATEAAQHLAKLTTEEEALAEWTEICKGIYSEFSGSLAIEGLTEAINHTSKLGSVQGSLADALEWSGISVDTFNEQLAECATEAEREALIRQTLNGIYSESAANYEKNNAEILAQRDAQAQLQENLAKVGEAVAPVITAFTSFANDALAKVVPHIQELAEKYGPTLEKILDAVAKAVEFTLGFIAEHWGLILSIAGVIGGITAAIALHNAATAIKLAMEEAEVTTVWGLVSAHIAQTAAALAALAPYLLIVAAIAAVIAIIVLCIKHWDDIVAAVKKAVQVMAEKVSEFMEKVKSVIGVGFQWVKDKIITPIKEAFSSVKQVFSNIVSTISEKLNLAKTKVKSIIDAIKNFFKFEWSLPKLKVPKFSIKPAGWSVGDLLKGSIPKLGITWNAAGGVFDKPTVFSYGNSLQGIAEAGAEAVVPLEHNLGWLDKLAGMLGDKLGGSRPVVLMVDGKVLAESTVNGINDITRQTGSIPLVIA